MNNNSGGMNIMYKLHVIIVLCLSFYLKFSYLMSWPCTEDSESMTLTLWGGGVVLFFDKFIWAITVLFETLGICFWYF